MIYLSMLLTGLQVVAVLYWFSQSIRVLATSVDVFESHAHKLLWFLTVVFVPVLGAVWFAVWLYKTKWPRERSI
jgi:hypothetical protein